ncbi:thermonuclease family protein [Maridesulfovibrio hydrothermalis]|uniref:Putative Micrococcal nuclease n=1 Tax=Maridesulfovibrio hydrothermalis AM13 = DSM 14728 TaxID=1121451 RepID=L0RG91_9BACT|nr:thermonuclease family protein [Maridesulfovibrio hydrothermalis]CCO24581.1 putative Micrococcal nuclease [Maridesulfovibrio hydrothermalis AM13 = DSM 14728]
MKKPIASFILLLCLIFLAVQGYAEEFRYLRPKDGDSFSIRLRGLDIDLRLISVDCPEYKQEFGQAARKFTDEWLRRGPAYIEYDNTTQDRYKRVLGYVWRGKEMLNIELTRRGYCISAYYSDTHKYFDEIKKAEKQAKLNKLGIWKNGGLKMTPSEFRKAKRHKKKSKK